MKLDTRNDRHVSLQVSKLYNLPAGDYRISEKEIISRQFTNLSLIIKR